MKILIIGDAGSIFIKEYIEYVLLKNKHNVVLIQEGFIPKEYIDFYNKNNVIIEPLIFNSNRLLFHIPKIRSLIGTKIWCNMIKEKYEMFDMIHIHGLNDSRGNIMLYLRQYCNKSVITVWGDELLKKDKNILEKYKKYYRKANFVTVSTQHMYNKFMILYKMLNIPFVSINKFAIGVFDIIDEISKKYTKSQICQELGIDNMNKYIVLVGHNGRESQRHYEITEEIIKLPNEIKNKIYLLYTMTYGLKNNKYLENLEELAIQTGCTYKILRNFLNEEMISRLRYISDILIHAQLTDAFSASIQECMYAGCIIINGSWLPYDEIPDYHKRVIEYDEMKDLNKCIINAVNNFQYYKNQFSSNKTIIKNISSRESTTKAWEKSLGLYNNKN